MTREEIEELNRLAASMGLYDDKNPCELKSDGTLVVNTPYYRDTRRILLEYNQDGTLFYPDEQEPCEDVPETNVGSMSLEEAIKHAEEVAEKNENNCKISKIDNIATRSWKNCAAEHRQLAEWLKELKRLRSEHEARANKESAQYVFDELLKCDIFRGKYDAKNGNEHFMYGVCTVMEYIANIISEECHDKFDAEFLKNMQESEDKE